MNLASIKETLSYLTIKPGDANGFVQLFFDNLGTVLALIFLMGQFLSVSGTDFAKKTVGILDGPFNASFVKTQENANDIVFGRAMPGLGITMVFGNIYYTLMGLRLAKKEQRDDVTALPYGVNTPAAFAFIFSIILPAMAGGNAACLGDLTAADIQTVEQADDLADCYVKAQDQAWAIAVSANMIVGIISVALGLAGDLIVKVTPSATLLTSLAGIGLAFLGISQLDFTFSNPVVGILPLYLMVMGYFGGMKLSGPIPLSLTVITVGILLGVFDGVVTADGIQEAGEQIESYGLTFATESFSTWGETGEYIGTILPLAMAAAAGTLMNVVSAKKAGDSYPLREAMVSDGFGTMVGALFGTPFGTSVYIGHPSYKKFGAGTAYSLINCLLFFIAAVSGLFATLAALVPTGATAPLLIYVGFSIGKEALEEMPHRQFPTFLIGVIPALADYASNLSQDIGNPGLLAMAQSSILLALVSSTLWWYIIERDMVKATGWAFVAAVLSFFGLIHQQVASTEFDGQEGTVIDDQWRFMLGYLMVTIVSLALYFAQQKGWVDEQHEEFIPEWRRDADAEAVKVDVTFKDEV